MVLVVLVKFIVEKIIQKEVEGFILHDGERTQGYTGWKIDNIIEIVKKVIYKYIDTEDNLIFVKLGRILLLNHTPPP